MANRTTRVGPRAGVSGVARDPVLVVDRLSKRYPGAPVVMFPPVVSMFQRDVFRKRRSSSDPAAARRPAPAYDVDDDLDDEMEDDDDDELEEELARAHGRPNEPFWALRDISFDLRPGEALGIVGGMGAGKSTLMRIIAGRALPTEGRVLVRGRMAPLPAALARALRLSDKGTFDFNLVHASRLVGLEPHLVKRHRSEIEELAGPLCTPEGEREPGWAARLAVATAVVARSDVILLEEPRRPTEALTEPILERVRQRVRRGAALVLTSRGIGLVQELCDDAILLEEGAIVERGGAGPTLLTRGVDEGQDAGPQEPEGEAAFWNGRKLRVPRVLTPFTGWAALHSAEVSQPFPDADLSVVMGVETALPDIEVLSGVDFIPQDGDELSIRVEVPEPFRFPEPGTYVLVALVPAGTLPTGVYAVRSDAIVSTAGGRGASVVVRDAGQIRIVGAERGARPVGAVPVPRWDGRPARRAEARWSLG